MTSRRTFIALLLLGASLSGQSLNPEKLHQLPTDTWPIYSGDYSGRRFSPLSKINASNVTSLSLAWVYRLNVSSSGIFGTSVKSTPLVVDGVMYFSVPDHVWAVDARTGRELWHYAWPSKGGMAHRQPRRGHVWELAVLRNARLQSVSPEHEGRQGTVAQVRSAIWISSTTAPPRRSS